MEHTPLPWKPATIIHLAQADDVDFAVRAANNHYKLLEALEELADKVSDYPLERASGSDVADAIGQAREAIEEARK